MATLKNTTINDTGHLTLPSGTTAQRPGSPTAGMIRYNSSLGAVEYYNGSTWRYVGDVGMSNTTPASSASQIRALYPNATDGDYWYKPAGYTGSAIQCYTNFSNAPAGKGYLLVGRGRESLDWWNTAGQNMTALTLANIEVNTPIAVASNQFVNGLMGNRWINMRMLVNRTYIADSYYIEGVTDSTAFSWGLFNAIPSSVSANIYRYTTYWKGGSLSYSGSNTTSFTDTLSAGLTGNDCTRLFTWSWSGHGPYQGWSAGSGCGPAGTFQNSGETHAIDQVKVYIEC
jgi:hypothetical protein